MQSPPFRRTERSRALLAWLTLGLLCSSWLMGCGGTASTRDPSRGAPPDLLTLLPADAEGVVLVNVRTLMAAPFVPRLDATFEPLMDDRGRELREILGRVDQLALAYRHTHIDGQGEPLLILARGRFTEDDLDTLGRNRAVGEHRQHPLRRDNGTVLARAGDHTLAFGSEPLVLAALDRMDGLAPCTGPTRPVLLDAGRRIDLGQHTFTFAGEVTDGFRGELSEEFSPRAAAVSVGAWVDLNSALSAHGFVLFSEAEIANEVATELRAKLAEAAEEPQAAEMGMLDIIRAIQIETDDATVSVDMTLDHETVERVVSIVLLGVQAGAATVIEEQPREATEATEVTGDQVQAQPSVESP